MIVELPLIEGFALDVAAFDGIRCFRCYSYGRGRLSGIVIVELPLIEGFALDVAVTVIVVAVSSAAI